MRRALRYLVIVFALLSAQQAAQLHLLSHIKGDLARAAAGDKGVPPLSHPVDIVFHAVDSALPCGAIAFDPPRIQPEAPAAVALPLARSPRIPFDSRGPPSLS